MNEQCSLLACKSSVPFLVTQVKKSFSANCANNPSAVVVNNWQELSTYCEERVYFPKLLVEVKGSFIKR